MGCLYAVLRKMWWSWERGLWRSHFHSRAPPTNMQLVVNKAIPGAERIMQTPYIYLKWCCRQEGGIFIKCQRSRKRRNLGRWGGHYGFHSQRGSTRKHHRNIFSVWSLFLLVHFSPSVFHGNTLHLPFSPPVEIYVFLFKIVGGRIPGIDSKHKTIFSTLDANDFLPIFGESMSRFVFIPVWLKTSLSKKMTI